MPNQQTSSQLEALIIDKLLKMRPELAGTVTTETAGTVTLKSLALDSLDTLQWAMEIEEAHNMEIEAVDFDPSLTLRELAQQLEALKQQQKQAPG